MTGSACHQFGSTFSAIRRGTESLHIGSGDIRFPSTPSTVGQGPKASYFRPGNNKSHQGLRSLNHPLRIGQTPDRCSSVPADTVLVSTTGSNPPTPSILVQPATKSGARRKHRTLVSGALQNFFICREGDGNLAGPSPLISLSIHLSVSPHLLHLSSQMVVSSHWAVSKKTAGVCPRQLHRGPDRWPLSICLMSRQSPLKPCVSPCMGNTLKLAP